MELMELSSLEYKVEPVSPVDSPTSNRDWTLSSAARSDGAAKFGGVEEDEEEELFKDLWPSLTKEEEAGVSNEEEDQDLLRDENHLFEEELLDIVDLEDIILKEEPFSSWLDNTGLYENPTIATPATTPPQYYNGQASALTPPLLWSESPEVKAYTSQEQPTPHTQDLFKEFEDVFSRTAGSLTPPDSPKSQNLNVSSPTQSPPTQQLVQQQQAAGPNSGYVAVFLQNMVENTVSDLDRIVANEVEAFGAPSTSTTAANLGEASPSTCDDLPWSSPSPSSTSGGCSDSGFDDPDWNPQLVSNEKTEASTLLVSSGAPAVRSSQPSGRRGTRSSRPAVNSTEERRMRKKEQNKNAATRYRMKKKQEMEEIIGEERVLVDKNERLKADATEIVREIRYLKSLMRDLLKAKGLLSSRT